MLLDVPANEKDKFSWCHLIFNAFDGDVLFEDVNYPHTHTHTLITLSPIYFSIIREGGMCKWKSKDDESKGCNES